MAHIFYGMSGEGRGHATRARALVEALRRQHRVTLFASDCAYSLLEPVYRDSDVRLVEIPGLQFAYGAPGCVNLAGTMMKALRYGLGVSRFVAAVLPEFERGRPDLVVADFEPILPRAARLTGVPFVSFDHQHYLVVNDLSALPFGLRTQAALAAPFVRALYDWQAATIVSSFYRPPLKAEFADAIQVGVLIRPELLELAPEHGQHLVAYVRRFATPELLAALAGCGREVRVYGLGAQPRQGNLRFLAVDERRFVEDLATCAAVLSTAGNQLVGEALHLGKPALVLPEQRNFEQSVNAYFLEHSGAGWAERGVLTVERLRSFLDQVEPLRSRIRTEGLCGNAEAVAAISRHVKVGARPPSPRAPQANPPTRRAPRSVPRRVEWA